MRVDSQEELRPTDIDEIESVDEGEFQVESTPKSAISLDKNDRSLFELHREFSLGRLVVDPDWQREYVWDRKRASKLIESFLIDIPVPVVYLAVNEEDKFEVIDGLQRLTSWFDFFENKFPLKGLEILPALNGKHFKELDTGSQSKLERTTLRTFELAQETPKELMFLIFERLNTGGIRLNEMEIRNCLYRGRLNNLIRDLAKNENFLACINQRSINKRMLDRTLVLRFLAFYERTHLKARKGLKRFLNEFFSIYRDPDDFKLSEYQREFEKAMRASVSIFGDKGFRLRRDSQKGGGEWAARPNAAVFQVLATSFTSYDIGQLMRRADAIWEEYVDLVSSDSEWVSCVKISTGDASRIAYVFDTWQRRLKAAIGDEQANDGRRCFSRSLKEELFRQDNTCAICGQRITLILDAALDHEKHYWRGGRTIPENARLTHRVCNAKRADD